MAKWEDFTACPGCTYDFATGEGNRSCHWAECPYMPAELDVFCAWCRFDFLTMEGNPPCEDQMTCEHGVEPRSHVPNLVRWKALHPAAGIP